MRRLRADGALALALALVVVAGTALGAAMLRYSEGVQAAALTTAVDDLGARRRDLVASWSQSWPADAGPVGELDALATDAGRRAATALPGLTGPATWLATTPTSSLLAVTQGPAGLVLGTRAAPATADWSQRLRLVAGRMPTDGGASPGRAAGPPAVEVDGVLGEGAARSVGLSPGDSITLAEPAGGTLTVRVTGTVAARDPGDDLWTVHPDLLAGTSTADAQGNIIWTISPLLSPGAMSAASRQGQRRVVTEVLVPVHLPRDHPVDAAAAIAGVTAAQGEQVGVSRFTSDLDDALNGYLEQRRPAVALAGVPLVGLLLTLGLVLAVTWQVLLDRRRVGLGIAAARGRSIGQLARSMAADGLLLGVPAVAVGAATGWALGGWALGGPALGGPALGGSPPGLRTGWLLTLALAALLPAALGAALTPAVLPGWARGSPPWSPATNRTARRAAVAVFTALAAAAVVALRSRRVTGNGTDPLVLATPALLPALAALPVVRLLGWVLDRVRRGARRTRGVAALLVPARAAATVRVLPAVAIAVAAAMAALAATLAATADRGARTAAVQRVGAAARLHSAGFDAAQVAAVGRLTPAELTTVVAELTTVENAPLTPIDAATGVVNDVAAATPELRLADPSALAAVQAAGPTAGIGLPADTARLLTGDLGPGPLGRPVVPMVTGPGIGAVGQLYRLSVNSRELTVRSVAVLDRLPGVPQARPWVLLPLPEVRRQTGLLLTAQDLLVAAAPPPAAVTAAGDPVFLRTPGSVYEDLQRSPLVGAVRAGLPVLAGLAAVLAVVCGWLALLATRRQRARTLALLGAIGASRRHGLVSSVLGPLPAMVAPLIVGGVVGVLVSRLVGDAADLRPLTGGEVAPALVVPWGALAGGALLATTVYAVGVLTTLAGRRAGPAEATRVGAEDR